MKGEIKQGYIIDWGDYKKEAEAFIEPQKPDEPTFGKVVGAVFLFVLALAVMASCLAASSIAWR